MSGDANQHATGLKALKPASEVSLSPAQRFLEIEHELNAHLQRLTFSEPVRYIYNPLVYAWETHRCYVETYCRGGQRILFLGMNPGPFGMAQTGVNTPAKLMMKGYLWFSNSVNCSPVVKTQQNHNTECFHLGAVLSYLLKSGPVLIYSSVFFIIITSSLVGFAWDINTADMLLNDNNHVCSQDEAMFSLTGDI